MFPPRFVGSGKAVDQPICNLGLLAGGFVTAPPAEGIVGQTLAYLILNKQSSGSNLEGANLVLK